eukprot:CAMPEP_0113523466 /NCGR_PEP_ID=MMETSP0014_2-20120614/45720_1 /TAXON_ID=2857 /ORGANISM="Nitzschia sp." /LENGTH=609 /DNA_ID=CAMNT_0000421557 /DNA_START=165 /DNA_END=1991 /DNA_ORIENTATION=- /assembly_acc=CAM_ASM_000159
MANPSGGTIVRDIPPPPPGGVESSTPAPEQTPEKVTESKNIPGLNNNNNNNNSSNMTALSSSDATATDTSQLKVEDKLERSVATLSNPWAYDQETLVCTHCRDEFNLINRRHHCRLCGKVFCGRCTDQRALIPPSAIVLTPKGGKKVVPPNVVNRRLNTGSLLPPTPEEQQQAQQAVSFSPDEDPDRMLTYIDDEQQLLYGKGLEERFQLAREPLRVCLSCHEQLAPVQEELRSANSNAMRFNHIDPTDPLKRFLNSPLAFTLGHEVRKAAYALNNLLPSPRRMGSVMEAMNSDYHNNNNDPDSFLTGDAREIQQCRDECSMIAPNFSNLDGVRIPARLLEEAKGVAVMTVVKGGFGLAGLEFGTGLVVARLGVDRWSAPLAIATAGLSWGALIGAQVSDHVFLLMTDAAVELMFNNNGNIQLGADVAVAVGPVGRAIEADVGTAPGAFAPIYTYSMSKGLYAGVSLDGKVIVTRERVNERFYGQKVTGMQILTGEIPSPPAARPLYEALQRCHVYATGDGRRTSGSAGSVSSYLLNRPKTNVMHGYPEIPYDMQTGMQPQQQQIYYEGMYNGVNTAGDGQLSNPEQPPLPSHPLVPAVPGDHHSLISD